MAEAKNNEPLDEIEPQVPYKPPAQVSVKEILEKDKEDPSLQRYKEQLLGKSDNVVVDPSNPKNVIVKSLTLLIQGLPDVVMDLSNIKNVEKHTFSIEEGVHYQLRIGFHVQREIVSGLKYVQKVSRLGVGVNKDEFMVGSYAPRAEMHSFTTPVEEAPSGAIHRGSYKVKSLFTDDDKNEWLSWEWNLEIKKKD